MFFASGCSDDPPSQQTSPGSGGSGSGGTAGTGASPSGNATLVPNESGWVDREAEGNTVGVQGSWYPYGDQYGVAKCINVGNHDPSECSTITSPDPLVSGFENENGVMCTTGEVAVVLNCGPGVPD